MFEQRKIKINRILPDSGKNVSPLPVMWSLEWQPALVSLLLWQADKYTCFYVPAHCKWYTELQLKNDCTCGSNKESEVYECTIVVFTIFCNSNRINTQWKLISHFCLWIEGLLDCRNSSNYCSHLKNWNVTHRERSLVFYFKKKFGTDIWILILSNLNVRHLHKNLSIDGNLTNPLKGTQHIYQVLKHENQLGYWFCSKLDMGSAIGFKWCIMHFT